MNRRLILNMSVKKDRRLYVETIVGLKKKVREIWYEPYSILKKFTIEV